MSSNNRGDRIQLLQKVLKKHFKPIAVAEGRSVLEQLLYASCLEDSRYDAAEEAFQRMQELYFDWNEVRVTTVTELADALRSLPNPDSAAARIKRSLQSIFETRYSFDLEEMVKMNQGKAIQELAKFSGVSRFMLAFVTQNSLGGHTIPVSESIMKILVMTGIVTAAEAEKHQTPGLERAIPKSKGYEVASCLHQLAAEYQLQPGNKNIRAILKEAGGTEPKHVEPPKPAPAKLKRPEAKDLDPKHSEIKAAPAKTPDAKSSDSKAAHDKLRESKAPNDKSHDAKESKQSKEAKATKPSKDAKETKDVKETKESKKTTVTKKALPPKKPATKPKTAAAAPSKKPVIKKITKRKPK